MNFHHDDSYALIESHNSNKRTVVEGVGTVRMFSVYSDVTLHVPVYTWRTAWSPGRSRCWRGAPRTRPPPPPPRPPRRCAARTWRSWSCPGWASLPHWCHCPRSPGPGRGSRSRWRSSRSTRTLPPEPGRGGNINNAQLSFMLHTTHLSLLSLLCLEYICNGHPATRKLNIWLTIILKRSNLLSTNIIEGFPVCVNRLYFLVNL